MPMPPIAPVAAPSWSLTWWLSVAQLVSWGSLYYSFSLFITPVMTELGWSKPAVTGAFSLGLLVAALLAIPVGRLIDHGYPRALMTGGSLLGGSLLAAWSYADTLPVFYVVWCAMGAALATVLYEPAFAVLAARYGGRYKRAIILMTLVGGLASTVFVPLTHWLIVEFGWRHALLGLAAINLLGCAPLHAWVLRKITVRRAAAGPRTSTLRMAARRPAFWGLLVCFATNAFVFSAVAAHIVPLLQEKGMATAALVLAVALIGPSQVLARMLSLGGDRWLDARRLGYVTTLLLPAALLTLYVAGPTSPLIWAFAVSYGMSNGIMTIVRGTAVPEFLGPEGYGTVSGALALPATLAKAAAPFCMSLVWAGWSGYGAVILVLLGLAAVSAVAFRNASRRRPACSSEMSGYARTG